MKRPQYDSDTTYDARQLKRLKEAKFPHRIRALPHVLKRIDMFALTPEHAAVEAAASNEIDWLQRLLPSIDQHHKDHVRCVATDVAAAQGHCEAIKTIYRWWVQPGYKPKQVCKRALMKAVGGGHHSPYDFDALEALAEAVTSEQKEVVRVICEKAGDPREIFNWAAEHDDLHVFQCVYGFHGEDDNEVVFEAMLIAAERGCLGIVKFVMEACGSELAGLYESGELFVCTLITAIQHGKRDVVDYLYEHDGYRDESFVPALCAAARSGSLELVKMLNDTQDFDAPALDSAFASAANGGRLEIMTYLQSCQKFDQTAIDEAFVSAAGNGQMEAVNFLSAGEKARRRDDQMRVLELLFDMGGVTPEVINEGFTEAASRCRIDVVEFLYSKGTISTELVDKSFQGAATHNCTEVVQFLYKTGFVRPKSVEKAFLDAAGRGDFYVMERLFHCGYDSQALLHQALCKHSVKELPRRVLRFLKQKQQLVEA
ncbi:hypothetical protein PF003_g27957 [Phytophthora fragariae]|uniref:Ankyrin repeat-containing domain n=1 Tax=Phytophthora fragariae TaxID=53985 RepID=A0A6A3G5X1_9STRA|nr:hypothetical protein PF003_g27957 [Phytophthora fragariae]KAE8949328.1 hypothetical protein PF009_g1144 [Phytophthora fragariae]